MPTARSEVELRRMLKDPLQKAVQYVVQKIWNENREVVRLVVYEVYQPTEYDRTMGFLNAWDFTGEYYNPPSMNSVAHGEFYFKPSEMPLGSTDPNSGDYAQHIGIAGSYKGEDAREYLADIIYGNIKWGSGFGIGDWQRKRDAWTELNKRIGRRKMKQWMKEGMEAAGLTVQMHNKAIEVTTTKVD